ncbi:TetR/AcrR family transcriptional regulator [Isoptericola cucumis]|uniref:TetR family transcriptional regulator n=2 Tax=Isoptericola cucumis TaxID=1776856 RepID=A0ABQ2BB61_9MICO|nr:TetR-like C-terminal domain-containing protein [Isoptericola cucumis]GGI09631.1 TetR family transcriptional regulator [Isoptericola cucumis]
MPRAGLSRDAVVGIALDLVDAGGPRGLADLTLAKVAATAGVATPSLYKHVGSLAALRRHVAVVTLEEMAATSAAATVGRSGPDALRALAGAWRDYAREHPGRYAATQLAPDPDAPEEAEHRAAGARVVAIVGAVLRGFGLPEARTVDAVRAVRAGIHGFVTLELAAGFRLPEDLDRSFDVLVDMLVSGVADLGDAPASTAREERS